MKKQAKIKPIRLHLALKDESLPIKGQVMLQRYAESPDGVSLTRDILIPSDMPLHHLHFAIQRLYGWHNNHPRSFRLPNPVFAEITEGQTSIWASLVGVLFQPPYREGDDGFWEEEEPADDTNQWFERQYQGPYEEALELEPYPEAQSMLDAFFEAEDLFEESQLDQFFSDVELKTNPKNLLERLLVNELLAYQGDPLLLPVGKTLVTKLYYRYGDDAEWTVKITKQRDAKDLLKAHKITEEEWQDAQAEVLETHAPVCLHKEGLKVMEDVGGLADFSDFLRIIYDEEDTDEATELRKWAKSMGWSARKMSMQSML